MRYLSKLIVSQKQLLQNLALIHQQTSAAQIILMVKAQAYGHGMIPIVDMIERSGLDLPIAAYGVASIDEGVALKCNILSDVKFQKDIYVFSELCLQHELKKKQYAELSLIPVIAHLDELKIFLSDSYLKNVPLCLKLNTGMNRLGFEQQDWAEIVQLLKMKGRTHIYHLMSHFAFSFQKNHPSMLAQQKIFEQALQFFRHAGLSIEHTSMANSGAIEQQVATQYSMVRPGLMCYGPSSLPLGQSNWQGKIISKLETTVLQVKAIGKDMGVGYGLTPTVKSGFLLMLPLGYGDGLQLSYSGFKFKVDQIELQFFARINMDLSVLFCEDPKVLKWKNKKINLWSSEDENLVRLSDFAHTIPYQILCALSSRISRDYALE